MKTYVIEDRNPDGRYWVRGVYTNKKKAFDKLSTLENRYDNHYYYGPHIDLWEDDQMIKSSIDIKE